MPKTEEFNTLPKEPTPGQASMNQASMNQASMNQASMNTGLKEIPEAAPARTELKEAPDATVASVIPGGRAAILPAPRFIEREFNSPLEAFGFLVNLTTLIGAVLWEGVTSTFHLAIFLITSGRKPRRHFRDIILRDLNEA